MSREIKNIEKLMNEKGMEFRDFRITNVETRDADGTETLVVQGMPITFEEETELFRHGDERFTEIIDRDAMNNCDMTDVIFNYNHGGRVYARTRNESLQLRLTDDGLEMRAELWNDDRGHQELYRDIQRGNIDKMSFAFTVRGQEFADATEDDITTHTRRITDIDKLFDVSAVDIPAYDSTSISARRAFDAESSRREAESTTAESRDRARAVELRKKLLLNKIRRKKYGSRH